MGMELRDNRGLICGFFLQPQAQPVGIDLSAIDATQPPTTPLWLHFNVNDTRARHWIQSCQWLAPDVRDSLLSSDHNIRLENSGNGIIGALADVFADEPDAFGRFNMYLDPSCFITGRRHPLAGVALLHQDLTRGMIIESTSVLFRRLLAHLAGKFGVIVAEYVNLIDEVEDRVFAGEHHINLGQHRRTMVRMRRQVSTNRHALADLCEQVPPYWGKQEAKDLRRLTTAFGVVAQDLELVEERARLLNEEIDSRVAGQTNRNLYFVSVVAAVCLPITLISGVFGMNVGGLPWVDDDNGFAWVMVCMAIAIIVAFAAMRWRRML
jgi:zinc transporter